MNVNIYAVYDTKAEAFGAPFTLQADGIAVRSFIQACENPESEFNRYPNDFTLYQIGTYDDSNAFIATNKPEELITAAQALKKDKSNEK